MKQHRAIFGLFFLILATACQRAPVSKLPMTSMMVGAKTFQVEIATKPADQEIGLMYRPSLDSDHGMIFPFATDQNLPFWNKNVHFPLDLFFTDARGKVVCIQHLPAFDEHNYYSDVPYRCVIELNGGMADKLDVKVGAQLQLPADAMSKAQ